MTPSFVSNLPFAAQYRFRAIPPNDDITLDHGGDGYVAASPDDAWNQLAAILTPQTVEQLQSRYTIEVLE